MMNPLKFAAPVWRYLVIVSSVFLATSLVAQETESIWSGTVTTATSTTTLNLSGFISSNIPDVIPEEYSHLVVDPFDGTNSLTPSTFQYGEPPRPILPSPTYKIYSVINNESNDTLTLVITKGASALLNGQVGTDLDTLTLVIGTTELNFSAAEKEEYGSSALGATSFAWTYATDWTAGTALTFDIKEGDEEDLVLDADLTPDSTTETFTIYGWIDGESNFGGSLPNNSFTFKGEEYSVVGFTFDASDTVLSLTQDVLTVSFVPAVPLDFDDFELTIGSDTYELGGEDVDVRRVDPEDEDITSFNWTISDTTKEIAADTAYALELIDTDPEPATAPVQITDLALTAGVKSFSASWSAPADGDSAITSFDFDHRVKDAATWESSSLAADATSTTISDLSKSTTYEARIRAVNAIGNADWSSTVEVTTSANQSPTFPSTTPSTVSVAEDTSAGADIGSPFTADDADGDTLSYSLTDSSGKFDIDSSTAQLSLGSGESLDHEGTTSYTITITATDSDSATVTHSVTISVTDVDEPPSVPTGLSVSSASGTSLSVEWSAPTNTGKPAISDYDVRYKLASASDWEEIADDTDSTATTATIIGLTAGSTYDVQVRAENDEGSGSWSTSVQGTPQQADSSPSFPSETTIADQNYKQGVAITTLQLPSATGGNGDLSYALTPTLPTGLDYDASTRQISGTPTAVLASTEYTYTVTDSDDNETTADSDSLTFDMVVAANNDPVFSSSTLTRSIAENSAGGSAVGAAVTATDTDNDTLTYSLSGTNASLFTIDSSSGQISTEASTSLDFESTTSYSVTVSASDGRGGTDATVAVTINVTDEDEPPSVPTSLSVSSASGTSLRVEWSAPTNTGKPAISDYDVRYKLASASDWEEIADDTDSTATSATVTGLTTNSVYDVAVRAENDEGSGDWSAAVQGTPVVGDTAPSFGDQTIADQVYTQGKAITPWYLPAGSGGNGALNYALTPRLPTGLDFNASRQVFGTPSAITASTAYTWEVGDSDDNRTAADKDTLTFNIVVTANNDPEFSSSTLTRSIAENSAGGSAVGAAVTATDADGDTLSYSLGGTNASLFAINSTTGQISTGATTSLDFETTTSYSVTVSASDGLGGTDATVAVTINVTDEDEPPSVPTSLSVSSASATSLSVEWSAPTNTGKPAISDYDVRYKLASASDWEEITDDTDSTATTATITGLTTGSTYDVQVRAENDEGSGSWSSSVQGTPVVPDTAPSFGDQTIADQSYAQGVAITTLQLPAATGGNGSLSYALTPTLPSGLDFNTSTRQISGTPSVSLASTAFTYTVSDNDSNTTTADTDSLTFNIVVAANNDPVFSSSTLTRSIAENSSGGSAVGAAVTATDADGDTLSYSLGGTNASLFAINSTTGQISTGASTALDYESTTSYSVTVSASDGRGGSDASTTVTINVSDEDEPPSVPTSLSVSSASGTSLSVEWSAPTNTGKPAISDYDVRYKLASASDWEELTDETDSTATTATITGLTTGSTYDVQVRAENDEGSGSWSSSVQGTPAIPDTAPSFGDQTIADQSYTQGKAITPWYLPAGSGGNGALSYALTPRLPAGLDFNASRQVSGTPSAAIASTAYTWEVGDSDNNRTSADKDTLTFNIVVTANNDPEFSSSTLTRSIAENSAGGSAVGAAVTATDADGDTLSYSLGGTNAALFAINSTTGQISTGASTALDYESTTSYSVTVSASDGRGGSDASTTVTINVTDEDEPPSTPTGLSVSSASGTSLSVSWNPPTNTGKPAISDYDVRHKLASGTDWTEIDDTTDSTATNATIIGLTTGSTYDVQVRAENNEGSGSWSSSVQGTPLVPDTAPSFGDATIDDQSYAQGVAITTLQLPAATGGNGSLSYALTPTLPTGLDFNASTRQIAGTPSASSASSAFTYTVSDNDSNTTTADTDSLTFNIVVAANNDPVFSSSTLTRSIAENSAGGSAVGAAVTATDANGDTLTYSLGGTNESLFTINTATGQISTGASTALDYESTTSYSVTVSASDGRGGSDASTTVTINVTDEDEPPSAPTALSVSSASATSLGVSWTAPTNTGKPAISDYDVRYKLASASDWEEIADETDSTATSATIISLTTDAIYDVAVRAENDEGSGVWSASAQGTPVIPDTTPSFESVTIADKSYGQGLTITILQLPVATGGNGALSYALTPTLPTGLDFNATTRQISGTPTAVLSSTEFTYTVSDSDSNTTTEDTDTLTFNIEVTANNDPIFRDSTQTRSIAENSAGGSAVGTAVTATDADGDTLSYTISGTNASLFEINSTSGQITTAASTSLDYEATTSYSVTVWASDGRGGGQPGADVTINVTDEDEPPSAPTALSVSSASATSLGVSWTAPTNTGKPAISDYDVRFKLASASDWEEIADETDSTATNVTLTGLTTDALYDVAVRAENAEGSGDWSAAVQGTPVLGDVAPGFASGTTIANQDYKQGLAIDTLQLPTATGGNGTLSYTLTPTLPAGLDFDATTRQISGTPTAVLASTEFTYTVSDGDDNETTADSDSLTFNIVVEANNDPVFSSETLTRSIAENSAGGSAVGAAVTATDADGDTLTYTLGGTNASLFTIDSSSGQISTEASTNLDYEDTTSYSVTVSASDGRGGSDASTTVTINVTDADEPPSEPASLSVSSASATSLDVSWDPPTNTGKPAISDYDVRYKLSTDTNWTEIDDTLDSTATNVTLTGLTTGAIYDVSVRAENDEGSGVWSTAVQGTPIAPDTAPSFGNQTVSDQSYQQGVAITTLQLPEASGGNGALSYTLTPTLPSGLDFDANLRQISGTPSVSLASTEFTYSVADSDTNENPEDTASLSFDIVIAVNNDPEFPSSTLTRSIAENSAAGSAVGAAITATDADGDTLSYSIGGSDAALFTISSTSGQISTGAGTNLDFEATTSYSVTVSASDNRGGTDASVTVNINVTDEDEPPAVPTGLSASSASGTSLSVSWNAPSSEGIPAISDYDVRYKLTSDTDWTERDEPTDSISTSTTLVGLTTDATYDVSVRAENDEGSSAWSPAVQGTPVEGDAVPGFASGTTIADQTYEQGVEITLLQLPAASGGNGTLSYTLTPALPTGLSFDGNARQISGTPEVSQTSTEFIYTVSDDDDNETAADTDSLTFNIAVEANTAPAFSSTAVTLSIEENSPGGSDVGDAVSATDADGDTLTYTLGGTDAASFTISSSSGQISTATTTNLDFEDTSSYSVTVSASDNRGSDASVAVTINITDVDEPPSAPTGLSVSRASETSLDVSWSPPENTGKPAISDYDVRYRLSTDGTWTETDDSTESTATSTTLSGLTTGVTYDVAVRAENDEGSGVWTDPVQGTTTEEPEEDTAPSFAAGATIADQVYQENAAITTLQLPAASGGNGALVYSLAPQLPSGLSFDASTRTVSGTPTTVFATTEYRYTVVDSDDNNTTTDSSVLTFSITVEAEPEEDTAPGFDEGVTIADQVYQENTAITALQLPAASGGNGSLVYSLAPALPSGLSFDASTRTISGTPTTASAATEYQYTVVDSDDNTAATDSSVLTFSITVEAAPVVTLAFSAEVDDIELTVSVAMNPIVLPMANSDSPPVTYSVSNVNPGLSFDTSSRELSGTPTEVGARTVTYQAQDADGNSISQDFQVTVVADTPPTFGATNEEAETEIAENFLTDLGSVINSGSLVAILDQVSVPSTPGASPFANLQINGRAITQMLPFRSVTPTMYGKKERADEELDISAYLSPTPTGRRVHASPNFRLRNMKFATTTALTGGSGVDADPASWAIWGSYESGTSEFRRRSQYANRSDTDSSLWVFGIERTFQSKYTGGLAIGEADLSSTYVIDANSNLHASLDASIRSITPYIRVDLGENRGELTTVFGLGGGSLDYLPFWQDDLDDSALMGLDQEADLEYTGFAGDYRVRVQDRDWVEASLVARLSRSNVTAKESMNAGALGNLSSESTLAQLGLELATARLHQWIRPIGTVLFHHQQYSNNTFNGIHLSGGVQVLGLLPRVDVRVLGTYVDLDGGNKGTIQSSSYQVAFKFRPRFDGSGLSLSYEPLGSRVTPRKVGSVADIDLSRLLERSSRTNRIGSRNSGHRLAASYLIPGQNFRSAFTPYIEVTQSDRYEGVGLGFAYDNVAASQTQITLRVGSDWGQSSYRGRESASHYVKVILR